MLIYLDDSPGSKAYEVDLSGRGLNRCRQGVLSGFAKWRAMRSPEECLEGAREMADAMLGEGAFDDVLALCGGEPVVETAPLVGYLARLYADAADENRRRIMGRYADA